MSTTTLKVWLGQPDYFQQEVEQLLDLLKQVQHNHCSIILAAQATADFNWILDSNYFQYGNFAQPGQIGLLTSGTTGTPKLIVKPLLDLIERKRKSTNEESRWLLCYNPARYAGFSILLHLLHKKQLIVPTSLTITSLLDKLSATTHLSLTPSLFRTLSSSNITLLTQAPIQRIIFGGEYATQAVLTFAQTIFPKARISHVYASTELGDICTVNDGLEGIPLDAIKSSFYLKNSELVINHMSTGDLWEIRNNRLYFLSRIENVINVGGYKVYGQQVEDVVMTIAGITDCIVYGISNALLGQVVGLRYVGSSTKEYVLSYLRQRLPKPAVPLLIENVDNLSLTKAWKKKHC